MSALPSMLADNPRLDLWVNFTAPGQVTISTGRVEIGQGVLTAMAQIAAEELDVAVDRIVICSGDTDVTPNEGYTAGSQSMQAGGVALRQACADVRALFLDRGAQLLGCGKAELTVRDGRILHNGTATAHDYWSLAASVVLAIEATGTAPRKSAAEYTVVGRDMARLDLPAKLFGQPVFIHDMNLDGMAQKGMAQQGMAHARVVRQPNRGATLLSVDEQAIRGAARDTITIVRDGNFLAIVADNETAAEAAAAAATDHVVWSSTERPAPLQQEANWLLQRPAIDRIIGGREATSLSRGLQTLEATFTRPHLAHASIAPSCGLAIYRDGHLTVWTHSQGVYPLRAAFARTLKLDPSTISVRHV